MRIFVTQSSQVDLAEFIETVERMESRISAVRDPAVRELWEIYCVLAPRFDADLNGHTRDVAPAKSAALMVLQGLAEARKVG